MFSSIKQMVVVNKTHDESKLTEVVSLFNEDGTRFLSEGIIRLTAISEDEPSNPSVGDLWFNLNDDHFYVYFGDPPDWVLINLLNVVSFSDDEPDIKVDGMLWYEKDAHKFYLYDSGNSAWIDVVATALTISQHANDYTPVLSDAGKMIEMSKGTASTFTVPADADVPFPVGTEILILATGAGQVTVAPAVGVTVNATPGLKLSNQWSSASLIKRGANLWVLVGDLTA